MARLSREEVIRICHEILEKAEKERLECYEQEAKVGVQYV